MAVSSWTLADFRGVGQLYLGGAELSSLYLGPFLLWARSDVPMYDVSPKGLRSRPKLGSPEITSASGAGLKGVAAQPLLGTPSLSVMGLEPVGLAIRVKLGKPSAEEVPGVLPVPWGISSLPILGRPSIDAAYGVAPKGLAAGTRVGVPSAEEAPELSAEPVGLRVGTRVGSPEVVSVAGVAPVGLAVTPTTGEATITGASGVALVGLAVTPTTGEATITGASGVVPVGLATQPTVGEPDVTSPSWEWTIGQSGTSYGVNGNSTGDGTTTNFGSLVPGMAGSTILYGLLSAGGAGDNIRCRVGASGNSQFPGSVSSFVMNIEGFGDVTMTWNSSLSLYAAVGTGARTYVTGQVGNTLTVTGFPT